MIASRRYLDTDEWERRNSITILRASTCYAAARGVDSSFLDCRVERTRVRQLRLFADTLPARLSPQFYQRAFRPTCISANEQRRQAVVRGRSAVVVVVVVVIIVNAGTHKLCRVIVVVLVVVVVVVVVVINCRSSCELVAQISGVVWLRRNATCQRRECLDRDEGSDDESVSIHTPMTSAVSRYDGVHQKMVLQA